MLHLNLQTKLLTSRPSNCTYNHVRLHNVRMHVHLISSELCILLPFRIPFRVSAFWLSQLPQPKFGELRLCTYCYPPMWYSNARSP